MTRFQSHLLALACVGLALTGCRKQDEASREAKEAPPAAPATIETGSTGTVKVDKPSQFPLVSASTRQMASTLNATGSVNPDISRELPVLSLANGRVVNLRVRLGDIVHRGQPIMDVQSPDISTAFGTYLKAVSDEHLTRITLDRDKLLYDKGAIPQTQLEVAENGEQDAQSALTASEQQLRILGVDKNHPSDTVTITAPTSGVVIAQNATAAGAAGVVYAGAAGSLTIADLSHVWVICDVYENDLASVHLGEQAEIRLAAYPGKVLQGTIGDIGAILDPAIRTAKVRVQVANPGGILRLGMFATATFRSAQQATIITIPGDSILHLHDRAFVFEPAGSEGTFRTVEVKTGRTLDGNFVEITSGLSLGQQVVANALELQNTAAQ
ncbi:membrane fusion protein, cobalt-zinc-cadmium efflux system [Granulicella pectinivorans]|jgi:cobalt-zinc-cadmium efflux system membrane fusion protein|uniref:Membrane fusion protein, cobalt-zinc-cadmium efflux system n=1 Tax=Granulicella pectinivorans TaxID=474950 RepID=A0A1I6L0U8_9BACT|nr:efflux RND transporter periplasmic adaptor subunit [Granulicella pectinivorans]SFR97066.1 membrane fusion protein, cobalt-zinc-cadmium efflux system [Granulicella pectinivorans]